ncbi:hypothetical protein BCL67_1365 [Nesterenkonia sandarakina]|uniref:Uncharacterized protein n=1 Tax=Nesterenkonia sandarakina TaxID=272918 RepID=A0A2T0YAG2_9MICC|nr:hypothetical protein BCL67_1365 [Nesterenkonia sandarakina]
MIPDTLQGVVLTALALTPGLLFLLVHERYFPTRKHSAVREIALFLSVAAFSYLAAIFAVALVGVVFPDIQQNLLVLFGESTPAPAEEFWAWATLIVVGLLACLLGAYLGRAPWAKFIRPRTANAWWELFDAREPTDANSYVVITSTNGDRFHGYVKSFSREDTEEQNRALVLYEPWIQYAGDEEIQSLNVEFLTVHASQISYLTVDYYATEAEEPRATEDAASHIERLEAHVDEIKHLSLWARIFKKYPSMG